MVFLQFSIKDTRLLPLVANGNLWIFTPGEAQAKWWYLVREEDWSQLARPGIRLGMSLKPPSIGLESILGMNEYMACDCSAHSNIQLLTPLPPWSSYTSDTEFRYVSGAEHVQHNVASIVRYQFIEEWKQREREIRNWLDQYCGQPNRCMACNSMFGYIEIGPEVIFGKALHIQDKKEGKETQQVSPCTLRRAFLDITLSGCCTSCTSFHNGY